LRNDPLALKESQLIDSTASHQYFEVLLSTYYIPLEIWYTRAIIDKVVVVLVYVPLKQSDALKQAHRLSTLEDSQSTVTTTTTPDDVFYILRIVLSRLLSTGSARAVDTALESLREAIDGEFTSILKKKIDEVYRLAGAVGSRGEKGDRESRSALIVSDILFFQGIW